eukprot:CAMPEP_0205824768 /NCGR_PEP_ID=MMETSP0206-20130828/22549_1 /ASSEMBLY_ACC=CAM_ASM_000279 /TAXON_ID=36767 /ORGANISM="Euplotes focardii, Strain TN1" /LENGTH=113 /DNA_ID=CAMNT_0053123185 /DNA_START=21 /DNA_END=358 /DNA_ORIENTATION=+
MPRKKKNVLSVADEIQAFDKLLGGITHPLSRKVFLRHVTNVAADDLDKIAADAEAFLDTHDDAVGESVESDEGEEEEEKLPPRKRTRSSVATRGSAKKRKTSKKASKKKAPAT